MSAENKPTPHFDEASMDQKMTDGPGLDDVAEFSLWLPPSNQEHAKSMNTRTSRRSYLDIDEARQPELVARIRDEYEKRHVLESERAKIGIRIVNEQATGPTIGYMSPWSTDADWENVYGVVEALALKHPDCKIVYIETPGMGSSSRLDKSAIKEISQGGSYGPMASQVADCLADSDLKFEVLVGVSEGARLAISLSEKVKASTVVTIDPPGVEDMSLLSFAKGFAIDEGTAQKAVKLNSPDQQMVQKHSEVDTPRGNKGFLKAKSRQYLGRVLAMAKSGLKSDIESSCAKGITVFDYRAGKSALASAEVAEDMAKTIPNYRTITLPNAPHSIVETNPFAVAVLVDQALNLRNNELGNYTDPMSASIAEAAKRIVSD